MRAFILPVAFALVLSACGVSSSGRDYTPPAGEPGVFVTLRTTSEGGLGFLGVGGDFDDERNPTLDIEAGDIVELTLQNGDGIEHDISIPDLGATSQRVSERDAETTLVFRVEAERSLKYICTVPGHRQAGMEGEIVAR